MRGPVARDGFRLLGAGDRDRFGHGGSDEREGGGYYRLADGWEDWTARMGWGHLIIRSVLGQVEGMN